MNQEIKTIKKEQEDLLKKAQEFEQKKGEVITRLVEIQGILKYLETKEKEK